MRYKLNDYPDSEQLSAIRNAAEFFIGELNTEETRERMIKKITGTLSKPGVLSGSFKIKYNALITSSGIFFDMGPMLSTETFMRKGASNESE